MPETVTMFSFNFTLSAEDAQNFLNILQNELVNMQMYQLDALAQKDISKAKWFRDHSEYLSKLQSTIREGMTRHLISVD